MSAVVPTLPLGLDPLIAEAKERMRRRRLAMAALVLLAAGLAVGGVVAFGGGGSPNEIPWLATRPDIGPANPPLAAPCTASQLRTTVFEQGAAGNLAAGIQLMNRSSAACALVGRPKLSLAGWRITRWRQGAASIAYDPLAPPIGSLRALSPHEHVLVQLWIPGYCRMLPAANSRLANLVLTAPGGGRVGLGHATFPYCHIPAGLTVQATRYTPFVPQGKPSSALPLKASIVSGPPAAAKGGKRIVGATLVAHAGSWLSFTVVLRNTSKHVFRFGRTCPAYTEGVGATENQAYVLNCHTVGAVAAGQSIRFAMHVHVPRKVTEPYPVLGWTLAPHSYNAPGSLATLVVR